ncbi:hypothetical protein F9C11_21715 [Amycolatopsis sp. VS8301801F10]|uniref:hypothetical protein n=1 Tax=Amycolatopsis sp. VS8301801F10 TaxID=2652442 RepID=UPI0038FD14B3
MVNKRMKAQAALKLARAAARRNDYTIDELPGRGKGSHRMFVVLNSEQNIVGRFTLTSHSRDISIGVLRSIEDGLSHLFGAKWMEK